MRISRLRLENWRNFSDIDVSIENRLFIVGANASGKSNLLDALRFLHELVTPGGGLQRAVERREGVVRIRNLAARRPKTDVVIDVELSEGAEILWRYRLAVNMEGRNSPPHVVQERVWQGADGHVLLQRPDDDDRNDPARLSQTLLEQTFANQRFRDIADFFASIQYAHLVPQLVRDPDRYVSGEVDPFGGDFLEQIASVPQRSQKARLKRIERALQLAVPQLHNLKLERDSKTGVPHLKAQYEHWRPHGAWQDEKDFSDGTLRLIGLLWALQDGTGPLLLEEPELSLHASITRYIPSMIQSVLRAKKDKVRQVFISTHSRDLLGSEGIDGVEILLLQTTSEGTKAVRGADDMAVRAQLEAGLPLAEAVLNETAPSDVRQIAVLD